MTIMEIPTASRITSLIITLQLFSELQAITQISYIGGVRRRVSGSRIKG